LTYALIGKKKTNEKTQLSASLHSGVQNQKKHKQKQKKTKKQQKTQKKQENQDDLQGQSACDIGLVFWFFDVCFFFCFVCFFGFFGFRVVFVFFWFW